VPGGAAGLQNQSGGRKVPGGFDSLPSPPKWSPTGKPVAHSSTPAGRNPERGPGHGRGSSRRITLNIESPTRFLFSHIDNFKTKLDIDSDLE